MDRTLTLDYAAAIPIGHRVEVTATAGSFALADLDTGVRYLPAESLGADAPSPVEPGYTALSAAETVWRGTVISCTIIAGAAQAHTTLVISVGAIDEHRDDIVAGGARSAAEEALEALGGADAALAAAKAEALRWSSTPSNLPPPRP